MRQDDRATRAGETVLLWFRRDLRLTDHPALSAALDAGAFVVPLFVLDDRLVGGATESPARSWFLRSSLRSLDLSLRARGSQLIVRRGRPEQIVPEVARTAGARTVVASRDVTSFSHRRDAAVSAALERDGRQLVLRSGLLLAEPDELLTASGTPYTVFTPFWRRVQQVTRRPILLAPEHIPTPLEVVDASDPDLWWHEELSGAPPLPGLPQPGEDAALARLEGWVHGGLEAYQHGRDGLDGSATSHLGADLHLGLLSPLQVERAAAAADESAAFTRQLAWREFYHHLFFHRRHLPSRVPDSPFLGVFRAELDEPDAVAAWRQGRTGIPVVDAGMRQLAQSAWLSNRARLVVASFLTRHLLMDYRIGERHFLRHLIDGDIANNAGGWQWAAGVGADPQPWFRIFNPVLQGRRFDPQGDWVRRWVPELSEVPDAYVHAPSEMPESLAATIGFRPGVSYPHPIVDLAMARERALDAFRSVKP